MTHDQFVGRVQHLAELPSRGDAERIIRATLETLAERLQPHAAAHVAAQLPAELGRHLLHADRFEHLTVEEFTGRVAMRAGSTLGKALFHTHCVLDVLCAAISPGAVHRLRLQLPAEYQELFEAHASA